MQETVFAKGLLKLELFDEAGNKKREENVENMIVNAGLAFIASRMKDATATAMTHMGVGDSATAAATAQTDLQAASNKVRVALDSTTLVTTTATLDSIQYVATFPAGTGSWSLAEAGLFNAASAGTMLSRTTFGVITKGATDSLVITWKIIIAD